MAPEHPLGWRPVPLVRRQVSSGHSEGYWPRRTHWTPCPEIARRLEAASYWTDHREGDLVDPIECEVMRTPRSYVLLVRIPPGHEGHAMRLNLAPVIPEPIAE